MACSIVEVVAVIYLIRAIAVTSAEIPTIPGRPAVSLLERKATIRMFAVMHARCQV